MQCAVILLLIIAIKTRRRIEKGAAKGFFVPLGVVLLGHSQRSAQFVFAFERADIERVQYIMRGDIGFSGRCVDDVTVAQIGGPVDQIPFFANLLQKPARKYERMPSTVG